MSAALIDSAGPKRSPPPPVLSRLAGPIDRKGLQARDADRDADDSHLFVGPNLCRSPLLGPRTVPASQQALAGSGSLCPPVADVVVAPAVAPATACVLVCTSVLALGVSWSYDFPGAMFSFLSSRFGHSYSSTDNQLLYSVYNWPNVLIVLLSGFAIDQWIGITRSTVTLTLLVLVGQAVFSLAVHLRLYWLAVVGRFVFGLGGEAIKVAQSTWIVLLSDASNMAWRFGIILSMSRLAGAVNFALMPTIGQESILAAVWIGTAVAAISFCGAVALVRNYKPASTSKFAQHAGEATTTSASANGHVESDSEPVHAASAADASSASASASACGPASGVRQQLFDMYRVLRSFPGTVWLQFAICVFYHVGVLLLYQIASTLLQQTGARYSERTASLLVAIPAFISIVGTPCAGYLADKYGHALHSILFASVLLILSHLTLIASVLEWLPVHGTAGLLVVVSSVSVVGVSYSIATASIWPLVPFLLPPSQVAMGYGAMASVENLGLAAMTVMMDRVSKACGDGQTSPWPHVAALCMLMATATIAAACICAQIYSDRTTHHGRLNKPAKDRQLAHDTQETRNEKGGDRQRGIVPDV